MNQTQYTMIGPFETLKVWTNSKSFFLQSKEMSLNRQWCHLGWVNWKISTWTCKWVKMYATYCICIALYCKICKCPSCVHLLIGSQRLASRSLHATPMFTAVRALWEFQCGALQVKRIRRNSTKLRPLLAGWWESILLAAALQSQPASVDKSNPKTCASCCHCCPVSWTASYKMSGLTSALEAQPRKEACQECHSTPLVEFSWMLFRLNDLVFCR